MAIVDGKKRCSKCGEWKDVGEFPINNRAKDGFYCHCKKCKNEQFRKDIEKRRAYIAQHKERTREVHREWRNKNREWVNECRRVNRNKDVEQANKKQREYRCRNIERISKREREYNAKNRDHINEKRRENWKNPNSRAKEYAREYRKSNPEWEIATHYFYRHGLGVREIPREIFDAKIQHIKLIRAIKSHKEQGDGKAK